VIKNLFKLAVFLLLANALYQTAPVWMHHYQFKDAVKEMALFSKDTTDSAVVGRVMTLAEQYKIPLEREQVVVQRGNDRLTIDASYIQTVRVVPGYDYRWPFEIAIDVLHVEPPHGVRRK
jgi:hypothetical protein